MKRERVYAMYQPVWLATVLLAVVSILFPVVLVSATATARDVEEVADMCMYSRRILKDYAMLGMGIDYHDPAADLVANSKRVDQYIVDLEGRQLKKELAEEIHELKTLWKEMQPKLLEIPDKGKMKDLRKRVETFSHRCEQVAEDLGMEALNSDIKVLTAGAVDEEEKSVLLFISFTRDEMIEVFEQPYSEENGALMLDFSESLLEGASLMAGKHRHKQLKEETMLVVIEKMLFRLERITKYYIAFRAGFDDHNNVQQLQRAITEFEADLALVNTVKYYPKELQRSVAKINKFWPTAKRFYMGIEAGALPAMVMISTDHLEKHLSKLEQHHHNAIVGQQSGKRSKSAPS